MLPGCSGIVNRSVLIDHLLRQHGAAGSNNFELNSEKRRLASFLGMTPENLSRAFKALEPYGVAVNGHQIEIKDPEELARFAKPNHLIDDYST